uniref:NADH dehydrogenase subunit 6 n=1 Tax=Athripsodes aterrimus TaxID=699862 RepID=A0A7D7AA60_9NEOP|nr:NADH dehydrogenase subunit 6 [Athripsodes aterrimus]
MMTMYLSMNLLLLFISSPLMIMMILIIQTIMLSLMIGIINKNFWFSYILFLIIIGGLMVLFLYMISLISNNLYKFNLIKMNMIILSILILNIWLYIKNFNIMTDIKPMLMQMIETPYYASLMKMYNTYTLMIMILIMNYLFFALIITTKIINLPYGPLRSY